MSEVDAPRRPKGRTAGTVVLALIAVSLVNFVTPLAGQVLEPTAPETFAPVPQNGGGFGGFGGGGHCAGGGDEWGQQENKQGLSRRVAV